MVEMLNVFVNSLFWFIDELSAQDLSSIVVRTPCWTQPDLKGYPLTTLTLSFCAIDSDLQQLKLFLISHAWKKIIMFLAKPQDSFWRLNSKKKLIFRKCRKSSENTIRCFEWHIVLQYCPEANYHYVHNLLWLCIHKCSGGLRTFLCFGYFLKMEAFRSKLLTGH